ncbi:phage tail tip lysozyme [Acinetobacter baumannii]|uniref:Tail tape measure protein n=3 Tax=Gammaproteobacteria TaxID=1236 RepID=A0AAD2YR36_ACIBA|nr:phage tail tip lysozyme [Acinetobacter baumannii]EJD6088335.1 tail tape measure protein [Acinetobacter baumannii]EJD6696191.1 tail tape measure protein [Acinetobacter baumannii]EJN6995421.1 tail tape measure protein [Acinetobacter baumannii]EKT9794803.1 tail tape measure protein [Acinetobacter baumannii]EKU0425166.1 tail tape measure protein [Acinetobacter baumannii]
MTDSNHHNPVLSYDELGFIIGMKRVEKKVSTIDSNIEKIIGILTQSFEEQKAQFAQPQPKLTEFQKMLNAVNNRQALDFEDLLKDKANPITQSFVVADKLVKDFADVLDQSINDLKTVDKKQINKSNGRKPAIEINSHEDLSKIINPTVPERDERGRFVSNPNEPQNQSSIRKVAQTISTAIKGVMPNSTQGVDPTVDAINEVGHLLSPVRRAAGLALRPLTGLMRSKKRNEPLPREQENHNRKQIKLLQRIADNLASKGGLLGSLGKLLTSVLSAGGGLLGGALGKGKKGVGKLGKGLGKFLKFGRGLPVIGALAAGASLLDWNEQSTQEKGGTVGSLAGGVIGGTVGSILGPAGTLIGGMAGSWIGNKLGTAVAPYFKEWTDSLIAADVPGIINTAWKGFVSYASNAFDQAKNTASKVVDGVKDTAGDTLDFIKDKFNRFNPFHDGVPTWGIGQGVYKPGFGANKNVPAYGATNERNISRNQADMISQMYDGAINAGFSHKQAIALLGEIGREGDFSEKNIFGSHNDPARGNNLGMFSWQGARRKALEKYLSERGLMNNDGTIKRSKEAVQAQFEFARSEMTNNKRWKKGFLDKKEISIDEARPELGGRGSYVGWARGQSTIRGEDGSRKPFDWQAQENKANQYSKIAERISQSKKKEVLDTKQQTSGLKPKEAKTTDNIYNQASKKLNSVLSTQKAIAPQAAKSAKPQLNNQSKLLTNVMPFKQPLNTPNPQEVVVVNQNSGNIGQNVNDRFLAHAFTGGIGMGKFEV